MGNCNGFLVVYQPCFIAASLAAETSFLTQGKTAQTDNQIFNPLHKSPFHKLHQIAAVNSTTWMEKEPTSLAVCVSVNVLFEPQVNQVAQKSTCMSGEAVLW